MNRAITFIFLFVLSGCAFTPIGKVKLARKKIQQNDLVKSDVLINKVLEKDSVHPGAYLAKSELLIAFEDPRWYDSAYHLVLTAQELYDTLDIKSLNQHQKIGIDKGILADQKERIDSLAFNYTQRFDSEEDYNSFLNRYPTAAEVPIAIERRNELAYQSALDENTYQSYKLFMEKYPEAEQVSAAQERYEKLYYEKSISDGRVLSYIRFLRRHPSTPYRREAEQKIFNVLTAEHRRSAYKNFIRQFPDSYLKGKAIARMFGLAPQVTQDEYNLDSLQTAMEVNQRSILPFFDENNYGFINTEGDPILTPNYSQIPDSYKCRVVDDLLILTEGGVLNKDGFVILSGSFDDIEILKNGLVEVHKNGLKGMYFQNGEEVLPISFDEVSLLTGRFPAGKRAGLWEVYTINGQLLFKDELDGIRDEQNLLIFQKDNHYDVKRVEDFLEAADNNPMQFAYLFTDYEFVEEGLLWMQSAYGEVLYDLQLNEVIPYEQQEIIPFGTGYLVEREDAAVILNSKLEVIAEGDLLKSSAKRILLKSDSTWRIYEADQIEPTYETSYELNFYGEIFVTEDRPDTLRVHTQSHVLNFDPSTRMELKVVSNELQYLVANVKKELWVIPSSGKPWRSKNELDKPIGQAYYSFENRGNTGLLDAKTGAVQLTARYDAVANGEEGYVSLLDDKKFGLFNAINDVNIPCISNRNIQFYGEDKFLVSTDDGITLVDRRGKAIIEEKYTDINYWSTDTAWVKAGQWSLINVTNSELVLENVESFSDLLLESGEKLTFYRKAGKYGVFSSERGVIIEPTFNDIVPLPHKDTYLLFTEKHIEEAEFYVIIYYDLEANLLYKQAMEAKDYDKIYCSE